MNFHIFTVSYGCHFLSLLQLLHFMSLLYCLLIWVTPDFYFFYGFIATLAVGFIFFDRNSCFWFVRSDSTWSAFHYVLIKIRYYEWCLEQGCRLNISYKITALEKSFKWIYEQYVLKCCACLINIIIKHL